MYNILKIINNVISYQQDFYLLKNGLFNLKSKQIILEVEDFREILYFGNNCKIIKDIRGNSIVYSNNVIDERFKIDAQNFPYLSFYEFDKKDLEGIYDYSTQKILFETTEWIGRDIFGEYIFSENQGTIVSRSVFFATPLWQFDLRSLGEYETYKGEVKSYSVEKFIGVWEDELLVACSNSLIISFDVKIGIEKRRWQTLENYYPNVKEVANKIPRTENFVLDSKTNTLIALHIFSLVKIDLSTGIIQVVAMENELKKHNINLLKNNSSYAIDDNHIYTTATMDYEDNKTQWTYDCLIAINRETYQVDWQYKFENEGVGTNTSQLSDNKLYQLTLSNTLFIFEKESEKLSSKNTKL